MLQKTKGIVLKKSKYSDTSLILKVYTEDYGLQSYILSGIRSKNARHRAALFQPLSLLDLVVHFRENQSLHRIREARNHFPLPGIASDLLKSTMALFMAEVTVKSIGEQEGNPELYAFIAHAVKLLELEPDHYTNLHLLYMAKLSRFLGIYPTLPVQLNPGSYFDLQEGAFSVHKPVHLHFLDPELSAHLFALLGTNFEGIAALNIPRKARKALLEKLILYYRLHIPSIPEIKSHTVLETVMA